MKLYNLRQNFRKSNFRIINLLLKFHLRVHSRCSHYCLIHTMEDDQRLNTLVHEGDALQSYLALSASLKTMYVVYQPVQPQKLWL